MADQKAGQGIKIISENRKARFNYQIIECLEAGIVLSGPEVKSLRAAHVTIAESYIRPENGELFWLQAHIDPYAFNSDREYDPARRRKLLVSKKEINNLMSAVQRKGLTIVPLKLYFKNGRVKLEIALAKGKSAPDKRDTIKKREADRYMARKIRDAR